MEIKKSIIDGMEINIYPFKGMQALKLERKVTILLVPLFSSLFGGKVDIKNILDMNIDFSKISEGLQQGLGSLSDNEFEELVLELLSRTQVMYEKRPEFINKDIFDSFFVGKLLLVYKIIFEVIKVNKFSFLELVGGGEEIMGMSISEDIPTNKKS